MTTPAARLTDRHALLAAAEAAGLFTAAQLAKATAILPPDAITAEHAARCLVAAGHFTRFQADRLLAGRTDGFVVGQYVILEQVGRGSVGRVYKAKHRGMNRVVAIKVLAADLTRTAAAREAFQREVRAAAKLNHPNIVTAYDANEIADRSYLVLEFVDGPTLDALVRERGPLPAAEACELIRQAAVGLHHAHEQGMVHRDIKPQNLLVAQPSPSLPGCVVKITDFGIARLGPTPAHGSPAPRGGLLGTPDYVAPEQAANPRTADHRADLYSLGCVFYFLLTGQPPFPDGSGEDKVRRHHAEAPAQLAELRPDVSPALAEIVHRLLAKDPNARFQTAAAVAARLDGLAAEAVAVEDDGTLISFDMPAPQPGQYSFASGYLTGMHPQPPAAETSPWAQLTDEAMTIGTQDMGITPVAQPSTGRMPKPEPARRSGLSAASVSGLCVGLLLALWLVLRMVK